MVIGHQFFPVKRGRPSKAAQSQRSKDPSFLKFYKSSVDIKPNTHTEEIHSQRLKAMISIISNLPGFLNEAQLMPLLHMIEGVARQFTLNEFELAYFSIILQNAFFQHIDYPIENLIKICGFITKMALESDCEIVKKFEGICNSEVRDLQKILLSLEENRMQDLKAVNKRFEFLVKNSKRHRLNYNFYVDEILRSSPPYQIGSKRQKIKKKTEKDDSNETKLNGNAKRSYCLTEGNIDDKNCLILDELKYEMLEPVQNQDNYLHKIDNASELSSQSPYYDSELSLDDFIDGLFN